MAKASLWQRLKNKVKEWVSGGNNNRGSTKSTKATPPATRTVATNRDARNQTVSSSINKRAFISSLKDTQKEQKEENRVANAYKATATSKPYKDFTAALKSDVPDPKQAAAQQAQKRAKVTLGKAKDTLRDNAKYIGNDTERETIAAIKKWNDSNKQQKKEFNERTNHKYDVKYWEERGDKKKAQEARIRVKSGKTASDIVAEELAVKYHPTAISAARGAASGATFGATELAIKAQAKRDKERAKNEQYYQENKNKTAETVGELAGAFASFGATAGATDRLGAKVVSKVAPNAAERLAETKLVQGLAKRGVNKALGGASEELIKQVGKEKAKKIVAAVGNDIIQNATTGLLYDFNKASAVHEIGSKEWWEEMGRSAAFNAAITGGIAGGAVLGGNKKLATEEAIKLFEKQRKQAVEEGAEGVKTFLHAKRGIGAGNMSEKSGRLFGKSIDERIAKQDAKDRLAKKMRDGAYGDIRRGVLPPSEIGMEHPNVTSLYPNPLNIDPSIEGITRPNNLPLDRARRAELNGLFDKASARNGFANGNIERPLDSLLNVPAAKDLRLKQIDDEINAVYEEIQSNKNLPQDEFDALTKRFDDLMEERRVIEQNGSAGFGESDTMYHAGDTGKAEWYGNQAGSRRGTGHLGTGTYLAGEKDILKNEGYGNRPLWEVDTGRYYKWRPKDAEQGRRVHYNLGKLNKASADIEEVVKGVNFDSKEAPALLKAADEAYTNSDDKALKAIADKLFTKQDMESIEEAAEQRLKGWEEYNAGIEEYNADLAARRAAKMSELDLLDDEALDDYIGSIYADIDIDDLFSDNSDAFIRLNSISDLTDMPREPIANATYEDAFSDELLNAITKRLEDIQEYGGDWDGWAESLAKDLGTTKQKVKQALKLTQDVIERYDKGKVFLKEDSASTIFMKALGYEGVNNKGIEGLDNTEYGSVIYDLLPEDAKLISGDSVKGATPSAKGTKPAAKDLEPRDFTKDLAGNQPKKEYTVETEYKSGKTYKRKVEASSEAEALDIITQKKGVKSAKIIGSSEITPKGTKSAAENLQTKELTQEEKRNNILNFIGEGDEAAPAVEATAKGAKPEAKILTSPYEETIANNPKTVDELGDHIGVKHEKVSNKEKTRDFWSSFRTKFVDSLDSYEQWNKQFLKTDPEKWAINNGAIDKLRRHQGMAVKSIDTNQLGWNGQPLKNEDGSIAKSLKAIYDGLDEEKENLFERYLLLRHAPARIAEKKPIFKGTFENADKCIEEAEKILADNPDFAKRAEELYQYTRNELQNRVDAGLLPQEVADDWFKRYPNYVPTGRVGEFRPDEDIWEVAHDLARNGNTVKAGEIKSASGSDLDVRSIKEQLSEATTRNWRDMSLNNLLRRMYGEKIGKQLAVEADGGLATVLDNTVNLKSGKGGKYYAEVFEDGKATRVEIEKRFYDAIKDLNKNGRVGDAIDFASDVAAKLSTPFKNVVTSWNPIFMVKNGMRDFPEAIINSRNTKEFMECMDAARRDLYGVDGGGMWTQALRNQGVSQANFVNLDEALTKGGNNIFAKGADKFATLQESVETYPRLVEFMATIKKLNGGTLPESLDNIPMEWLDIAAANAADVTVNFGRSGSIGKMLNRGFVPFFNPSVQGFDKFVRNLSQQPSGKALLGTIAKAFALGTGATAINNMLLSDNPYYQQIAAREKATNIIIACPLKFEDGKVSVVDKDEANIFIKIPKSRFAAAYSIPMVNVANDNKMGWAEMIKVAGDQVAPVNPIESNILAPFALAAANKTWYGTPIVSQGIENKTNPSQEYDANTSLIGKALGKATSKLPTELQISPKKADYVIDATTGVIGDFVLPALTPSRQGGGGFVNKYITHPAGNVVKRAFTIDANTQNDLSTRFYDELQKATDNSNSEIGTQADKDEYKRLNAYSKETAGINQAIRYLQGSDSPTKQKDIYELQKVRNQLMQDALDGKGVPTSEKMLDAVQKYVGTTYAIDSFGSSADKDAMKVYGEAVYGNLSEDEMKKRIDSDKDFYNGVRAIGGLEDKLKNEGLKGTSVLSRAVALASANANDDLFGAYECTKQSRTETANKMTRAKDYIKNGGSEDEFVKLEKVRKDIGKLPDEEKDEELDKIHAQLANGDISYEEFYNKQGEIEYNANISRVGLATSLALANSPERAYRLYDIKDANIQKGINLAAMGYDARSYREMAKAVDTSGNGYLSKQEVVDYVANSGVEDKATLFEALYPYRIKYNPFGTPTKYSIAAAAQTGKGKGIEPISGANNDFSVNADSKASGNSYGGYGGRKRYRYGGGGRGVKVSALPKSNYKASKQTYKDIAATLRTGGTTTTSTASKVKIEPPKVKFKEYEV